MTSKDSRPSQSGVGRSGLAVAWAAHNWVGPQSCEIRLRQRQVSVSSRRPGLHAVFSWLCAAVPVFFGHRAQNHQSKKNNQPPVSLSHDGARGGTRLGRDPSHKLENPTVVLALRFLHSPLCFFDFGCGTPRDALQNTHAMLQDTSFDTAFS